MQQWSRSGQAISGTPRLQPEALLSRDTIREEMKRTEKDDFRVIALGLRCQRKGVQCTVYTVVEWWFDSCHLSKP